MSNRPEWRAPSPLELLNRILAPRRPSGVPFASRLRTPSSDGGRVFLIGQAHAVMMLAMVILKQLLDGDAHVRLKKVGVEPRAG